MSISLERCLKYLLVALSLWYALTFAFIGGSALTYPFNLEWMEGQSIDVIARIVKGQSLYVEPSLEYVPFIYTPYFYYLSAFVSLFTGVDFIAGRLVSFCSALGAGLILYLWTLKEGGKRWHGLVASGLFFATYELSGRWFDIARVDSLFILLTLSGLYLFCHYRGLQNQLCAALLLTAAFFTKQSTLMICAPIFAAGLLLYPRHALITGSIFACMLLLGIAAYNYLTDGWFAFYVFEVPAGHRLDKRLFLGFWKDDLLSKLAPLLLLAVALLATELRKHWREGVKYGALAAGFIGASYASRLHMYGWINVLIPAHAILALLSAILLAHCPSTKARIVVVAAIVLQFALLAYNPTRFIPSKESVEQGNTFLSEIAKYPGDLFIPDLQFVQTRVGKKSYAYGMAGVDIMRANLKTRTYVKNKLRGEMLDSLKEQRFGAVMTSRLIPMHSLNAYYRFDRHLSYPREYVSGAINFMKSDLFVPIDKPPVNADDSPSDKELLP